MVMPVKNYKRIVVKIGSNVLTREDGLPDEHRIAQLVGQLTGLKNEGTEIVLVSSGAVASGRSMFKISEKHDAVAARQLLAAIGQIKLINTYQRLFEAQGSLCAQVLVTKEDFRDRRHYLNIRNCLSILLKNNVIPVVNENDVVSVTELMFTDNDELAGLVAAMLNADALIILSNIDGLYDGNPANPGAQLITELKPGNYQADQFISPSRSGSGRGGMVTKLGVSRKVARLGIPVYIANGTRDHILTELMQGTARHTYIVPERSRSGRKKWIAHSEQAATGSVTLNEGAAAALESGQARSLLPVGITAIQAGFRKGDIIRLLNTSGGLIGLGIAEYDAERAAERLGQKGQKPLVHYNYFYSVR